MKSVGWLAGCALALACAHEGKGVVGESDMKMQGTVAREASQPQADSTADAATGYAVARPRNGSRSIARRPAGKAASARSLLGDGLRLA